MHTKRGRCWEDYYSIKTSCLVASRVDMVCWTCEGYHHSMLNWQGGIRRDLSPCWAECLAFWYWKYVALLFIEYPKLPKKGVIFILWYPWSHLCLNLIVQSCLIPEYFLSGAEWFRISCLTFRASDSDFSYLESTGVFVHYLDSVSVFTVRCWCQAVCRRYLTYDRHDVAVTVTETITFGAISGRTGPGSSKLAIIVVPHHLLNTVLVS